MLGFTPVSGAPLSSLGDALYAVKRRTSQVRGPNPHVLIRGRVTRRGDEPDAGVVGARIAPRASRPQHVPPQLFTGGKVDRRGAWSDVPGILFSRLIYPLPQHQPNHPVGSVSRRPGHPDAVAGKRVVERISRAPLFPWSALRGKAKHVRGAKDDPPPAPSGNLVPNLRRFIVQALPPAGELDGTVTRKPKKVHFTPQGPTELLFLVRRVDQVKPPFTVLSGGTSRRRGHAPDNDIPRNIPSWHRFLKAKFPIPFRGRVIRRHGWSQDIVPAPFDPIKLLRRFVLQERPSKTVLRGRTKRRGGVTTPTWVQYQGTFEQVYRVADASKDTYELWVGVNGAAQVLVATSATLPITWTPTGSGNRTLAVTLKRRNAYDLPSFNVYQFIRRIDGAGNELPVDPSAPFDASVLDAVTGYVDVLAKYSSFDDVNPADSWDVWVKDGVDPVPSDPVSYTGTMPGVGPEFGLVARAIGPFTPGNYVHVLVAARRASDGVRSFAPIIVHQVAPLVDLSNGDIFGGTTYA